MALTANTPEGYEAREQLVSPEEYAARGEIIWKEIPTYHNIPDGPKAYRSYYRNEIPDDIKHSASEAD